MISKTSIALALAYPISATVIPLFPCTDGSNQGGFRCVQVMAITGNPAGAADVPLIKQGRVPINTLSDDTIIHFPLIPSIGEAVGRVENLIALPGHLAMEKWGDVVEDLAVIPTLIKRYISPAGISLRSRRNIFVGLGFGSGMMHGNTRPLRSFALTDNFLILNPRNEARDFCSAPDEIVFVPHPRNSRAWSLNVGGLRVVSPSDSVRRQAPANVEKFSIDSFSRTDLIPHQMYDQLVRAISMVPGVAVVEQLDGPVRRPARITNCVGNFEHFPALEYRITDDDGNHLITLLMDPESFIEPIQRADDMTGCELNVSPTWDPQNYRLGVNLFKHNLVYFERNTDTTSRIGFCDPI